jgi:hypothetical protein
MLRSSKLRLLIGSAAAAAVPLLALTGAGTASASVTHPAVHARAAAPRDGQLLFDGNGFFMDTNGLGAQAFISSVGPDFVYTDDATWTDPSGARVQVGEMVINGGGNCLEANGSDSVVVATCNVHNSGQLWYFATHLNNVGASDGAGGEWIYAGSNAAQGSKVIVAPNENGVAAYDWYF